MVITHHHAANFGKRQPAVIGSAVVSRRSLYFGVRDNADHDERNAGICRRVEQELAADGIAAKSLTRHRFIDQRRPPAAGPLISRNVRPPSTCMPRTSKYSGLT